MCVLGLGAAGAGAPMQVVKGVKDLQVPVDMPGVCATEGGEMEQGCQGKRKGMTRKGRHGVCPPLALEPGLSLFLGEG